MKSISFPEIFNSSSVNIIEDHDATLQNLKLLLWSEKGELFGDPYYGTGIKKYMFDQNDTVLRDILIDDIYSAIRLFMPQIAVNRSDIKINKKQNGEILATIKCINKIDFTTDLYNIVLLEAEV